MAKFSPSRDLQSFPERFQAECIFGSAIREDLFEAAVDFIEDTGFWEPNQALGQRVSTFHQTPPHNYQSLAVFRNEDGSLWQAKPEKPRLDRKKNKPNKYESPKDGGNRIFTPPVPSQVWEAIAERYGVRKEGSSFWDWVKQHPEKIPVVITEGGKKALSLLSHGYVAVSLYGCHGISTKEKDKQGFSVLRKEPKPAEGLSDFISNGRRFCLAFDQDSKIATNKNVESAIDRLARYLERQGCEICIVEWDGKNDRCKGIDDLIANDGIEAWEKALENALPSDEWCALRSVRSRLNRSFSFHIGNDEFVAHTDKIPDSGIVVLHGRKGTAKTGAIAEIVAGKAAISITPTRSLARDQAERVDGVFLQDADFGSGRVLHNGKEASIVVGCVPSIHRLTSLPCEVLMLDELTATLEFLYTANFKKKDGRRQDKIEGFKQLIRNARLVVISDADLTWQALDLIEKIKGTKAFIVATDRKPLTYNATFMPNQAELLNLAEQYLAKHPEKLIPIHCDTKAEAEQLSFYFGAKGYRSLLITSMTSGDELQTEFLQSKGGFIPDLLGIDIRVVIASPSIQTGFSITQNTDLVGPVFISATGASITPEGVAQTADRWRCSNDRFFYAPKFGKASSRLSRATSKTNFILDAKRISKASFKLTEQFLSPETRSLAGEQEILEWESPDLQYLAEIGAARNIGMMTFRARIKALLRYDGKSVHALEPTLSEKQFEVVRAALREAKAAKDQQHKTALTMTEPPTPEEFEELVQREALSAADQLKIERFCIEQFYKQALSMDLLEFDKKGRTRKEIQRLEELLLDGIAANRTTSSIEQNPQTPQDWNRSEIRRWLMNRSGLDKYVWGILKGEIENLKSEEFAPIVAFVRAHPQEYELALGGRFRAESMNNIGDQQLLGTLLRWYGVKTIRDTSRIPGTKNRFEHTYRVDGEHLKDLVAVLCRRNPDVPPLVYTEDKEKGGTPSTQEFQSIASSPHQPPLPSPTEIKELIDRKRRYDPNDPIAM